MASYMVVDLTDGSEPPVGKFGPFDSKEAADTWIGKMARPDSYFAVPSDRCR